MGDYLEDIWGGITAGAGELFNGSGQSNGDIIEAARMDAMQPGETGASWWENALKYGLTRGIDSIIQAKSIDSAIKAQQYGIGYQGADGRTLKPGVYPQAVGGIPMSWLLVGGVVVLTVVLLKD